ncbi:hypothetical protein GCM10009848_15850 [Micromonospora lupini]|uniref:Uncharacterized protein n=1 Tax=Micromonospora lupini str. Lupac 08 TaxID=1150864 RepID=I0LEB5_9ACTN|nr:Protein of unknown function [Micromonospora lupini str. Lupac 08]
MNGNGVWPPNAGRRGVRILRKASLGTDGAVVMALLVGREGAAACAGALSTALRCAAELLEGPSQR